ncbi:MAG: hypothetical protein HOJ07_17740, partial [Rhodospirillaceae bacterium]|nr:hypothetical protein [Rhodospirillaceae bacterium]
MCEPTTIIMAVTAVMAAYSAQQQAKAQKSKAKFDAGVARNNQVLLQRAAQDRIKQGDESERQYRVKVAQMIGRQRAGFAANGVLVNDPGSSPQNALLDTRTLEATDISILRENTRKDVDSLRFQAANAGAQAGLLASSAPSPGAAAGLSLLQSAPGAYNSLSTSNTADTTTQPPTTSAPTSDSQQ